jgi:hypothetical protein
MDLKKVFDALLYFIILPLTALSFVLTPLTNDSRIFIGAEAIADTFYKLPYGWDAAYEVKPIGNRIVNWVLYKVANAFVPFTSNDYTHFGYVVKLTALIILIACCWYISRRIKFPYVFPFLFIAFACEANFGIMMSEWFAVLFSLVAIGLCFEKNRNWQYVAGAICLCVGLLKSITVLMVIPVICAVLLLGGTIDWKKAIAGYLVAGITFLIACLTVWPYSISDMLMSRMIAHVGMYDYTTLLQWFWMTQARSNLPLQLWLFVPAIAIGIVACGFMLLYYSKKRDLTKTMLIGMMWAVPVAIVFIQSEFIIYHYIVILLAAIVSVALITIKSRQGAVLIIVAILLVFPSYVAINSVAGSFTTYEYTFWHQKEQNADLINAQYNLTNQSSILYLDPGDASYYFHANSSCHYITPMPVERSTDEWNLTALWQYNDTHNCIMSYQGEYIVADINGGMVTGYYGKGILIRKEITDMIKANYTLEDSKSWDVYKRKTL